LLKPAQLNWSADLAAFGPLCLKDAEGAEICLHGEYQAVGESWFVTDIARLPLNYIKELFELDLTFEQYLEGRLEWRQAFGQAPTGGADFRMTAGKIFDIEGNDLVLETSEGHFAFALQNGNLESGRLDLEFPGSGYIDIDFSVLDIIDESARKLQGRVYAQLDDIQALAQVILPGMDEVSGRFESDIQLSGTLTDPLFEGGFNLSSGLVDYAPVGVLLEEIEFEGQLDKFDRGSFKGGFRAGEGIGSINGQFLFNDF
jgi:autotransporter translocation and assembly factor TamB